MKPLIDVLVLELERPRALTPQVIKHIAGTHGVGRDDLSRFLVEDVPKLEDFEIDLLFSPLFTPSLQDQTPFAELLGASSVPRVQWAEIEAHLLQRPTRSRLLSEDGLEHRLELRAVTIERYVHRLRLDAFIPEALLKMVLNLPPAKDRPLLKAIARRAVWELPARREILELFLSLTACGEGYTATTACDLLKLIETYQPSSVHALLERLPHWIEVARNEQTTAANPKPFFSQRIHEMHGGGRDQRRPAEGPVATKEKEIQFLQGLFTLFSKSH